ncbi:MAG: hypothetical protein IJN64_15105 [Lachnospiraceae bacterium]|nr:hypothetical protein [Lachnospiraceae bacterium]
MKFDPITGELINDTLENEVQEQIVQKQENMAFDPITGELVSKSAEEQAGEKEATVVETSVKEETVIVHEPVKEETIVEEHVKEESVLIEQTVSELPQSGEGFDPMTGQPIGQQTQSSGGFDPVTGQPIGQQTQSSGGFDPMTGQPIGQQTQSSGGFDPMTGQPIGQQTQSSGGFDPMTGQPLEQQTQSSGGFDPMTGQPLSQQPQQEKKSKNKMLPVIGAVVAVVAVLVLVVGLFVSGVFSGPAGQIRRATLKTFKEMPHFVQDLQGLSMLADDKYTLGVKMTMEEESIEAELRSKASEKQIYAKINVDDVPEMTLLAGINESEVKLQIPELLDQVLVYNFKDKNKGYITEEADEESLEMINSLLEDINAGSMKSKKYSAELCEVFLKEFNSLEFEKADKEQYRVDGEKRNCKGYITKIKEKNVVNIIDGVEKVVNKYIDESMKDALEESGDSLEDLFDDMRDDVEDMEDIEISFYLYRGMLASIKMENTDTDATMEVLFKGGDYRAQNIELVEENDYGESSFEMKGSVSDSTEKFKFISNGNKDSALEIKYDYKSGDFEVQQDSYTDIDIKGNLKSSASDLVVKFEKYEYGYDTLDGAELEITLSNRVKMGKFKGKEFDLGNASEEDMEDFAEDLEDAMYDNDLEDLMEYF